MFHCLVGMTTWALSGGQVPLIKVVTCFTNSGSFPVKNDPVFSGEACSMSREIRVGPGGIRLEDSDELLIIHICMLSTK